MHRINLLFLTLLTAMAAIALAPPLPASTSHWQVAEIGPAEPP